MLTAYDKATLWMVNQRMQGHVLMSVDLDGIARAIKSGVIFRTYRCSRCTGWLSPVMKGHPCPGKDIYQDGG